MSMAEGAAAALAEPDLYDLLMTQAADGSFPLGDVLLALLEGRADEARAAAKRHGDDVVGTALALAVLAATFADRQDEWTAAAKKAKRWIGAQAVKLDPSSLEPV